MKATEIRYLYILLKEKISDIYNTVNARQYEMSELFIELSEKEALLDKLRELWYDKKVNDKMENRHIDFEGNTCVNNCLGWDGVSHRCQCGNKRVRWEYDIENDMFNAVAD